MQLDTGNLAMAGRDPHEYMERFGTRYWLFHIQDVPRLGATHDAELGTGALDFKRLLASIDRIDEKHLFVEQETYPGTPLDETKKDKWGLPVLKIDCAIGENERLMRKGLYGVRDE
jgi:sugar phosphate isomerase/epimerase